MTDRIPRAALAYAQKFGWPVFPCLPGGKRPLTEHGLKDATTDAQIIQKWWKQTPNANIGIVTGPRSGFDVLDIDTRYGGEDSLGELVAEHGNLPETVEALTGGGGRHILFRHHKGLRNSAGRFPGLDVRGEGGYIVAAPSQHENGRSYAWELSSRPGEVEVSDWPIWLLNMFTQKDAGVTAKDDHIPEGQRNVCLTSIAGSMRRLGMCEQAMAEAISIENQSRCMPPLPEDEVRRIAASVARYNPSIGKGNHKRSAEIQDVSETGIDLEALQCIADVPSERVEWLWYPRIPLRHLTVLDGDPGEGKSFISQAIATALSNGQDLPGGEIDEPANSLLLTAEDHLPTSVRPRLEAMGADINRIYAYKSRLELDAVGRRDLEDLVRCTNARLVVVDPIVAFMPSKVDIHRANEVRSVLSDLSSLAERCDCAILIVRHLAKSSSSKSIYRGLGSIDFTAACRSALLAGHDPGNPRIRALVQIKNNLGPMANAEGYSIDEGKFRWTGMTDVTASQLLAAEVHNSALGEAKKILLDMLADGGKPSKDIQEEALAAGISKVTLNRAKKALGIKSQKIEEFQGAWLWELAKDSHR